MSAVLSFRSEARVVDAVGVIGGHCGWVSSKPFGAGEEKGESGASNEAMSFASRVRLGAVRKSPGWYIPAFFRAPQMSVSDVHKHGAAEKGRRTGTV